MYESKMETGRPKRDILVKSSLAKFFLCVFSKVIKLLYILKQILVVRHSYFLCVLM